MLGEDPLDQFLGPHLQVEHGVGNERDPVQVAQPLLIHAADEIPGHQGVNVTIGQHHRACAQGRQDGVLELVGEVGRVEQRERGARENVALLGGFEFFADQRGAFETHLNGVVARGLQPLDESGDLGGSA